MIVLVAVVAPENLTAPVYVADAPCVFPNAADWRTSVGPRAGRYDRCPGVGITRPSETGPTGTNGGAKVGTGPVPSTRATKVVEMD